MQHFLNETLVFVNVLGKAEAKTSLYVNGTTAKEITDIKDALIDKQSEAFKDIESDFISKLDSTMSTFYPTTKFELSYIDFVQGAFKNHFLISSSVDQLSRVTKNFLKVVS